MHLAVVGVTGLVGQVVLDLLNETKLPYDKISFVASERSVGKIISWNGHNHTVISMEDLSLIHI